MNDLIFELKTGPLISKSSNYHSNFSPFSHQELLGKAYGTIGILNRLIIALKPSSADSQLLEAETQHLAQNALELRVDQIVPSDFFFGMVMRATKDEWRDVVANTSGFVDGERDVVEPAV